MKGGVCHLSVTKNLGTALAAAVPIFIAIGIVAPCVASAALARFATVPGLAIASIAIAFFAFRKELVRHRFFDDHVRIEYLLIPRKSFDLPYGSLEPIRWKRDRSVRGSTAIGYAAILQPRDGELRAEPRSRFVRWLGGEGIGDLPPESYVTLGLFDIARLRILLRGRAEVTLDGLGGDAIERLLAEEARLDAASACPR